MPSDMEFILTALRTGNYTVSEHADLRMNERGVKHGDIQEVGHTYYRMEQQSMGKYLIEGHDFDGEILTIICAYNGDTLIVTLY